MIGNKNGAHQLWQGILGFTNMLTCPLNLPICALYQRNDELVYIGTRSWTVYIWHVVFNHQYLYRQLCTDFDNIMYNSPTSGQESLLMGTENGITIYCLKNTPSAIGHGNKWLMSVNFNTGSIQPTVAKHTCFGSNNGAVRFFATDIQMSETALLPFVIARFYEIAHHPRLSWWWRLPLWKRMTRPTD